MDVTDDKTILLKIIEEVKKESSQKDVPVLFDEDSSRIKLNIVVGLCKIPKVPENGKTMPVTLRMSVPHSFVDESTDVLLIAKKARGAKSHQASVDYWKSYLLKRNAAQLITQITTPEQFKNECPDVESKREMASRFDYILSDRTVFQRLAAIMGKPFLQHNKKPISVYVSRYGSKDLKKKIEKLLSKCTINLTLTGTTSHGQFGKLDQSSEHLMENLYNVVKSLKMRLPGGENNIRSLHIKSSNSKAFPLLINNVEVKKLPEVEHPKMKDPVELVGELSTLSSRLKNTGIRLTASGDISFVPIGKDKATSGKKTGNKKFRRNKDGSARNKRFDKRDKRKFGAAAKKIVPAKK